MPDCRTSNMLYARFGRHATIEDWVDSIMAEDDRRTCFGRTAISRAKRQLSVVQVDDPGLGWDGELRLVCGRLIALIGPEQSRRRETFTIAHELGHGALYALDVEANQDTAVMERLCDMFAAELIMPTRLVRDIWRRIPDAEAIPELASKTESSLSASCIRIAEYLADAITGIASGDGIIQSPFGMTRCCDDLKGPILLASISNHQEKFFLNLLDGLTLSVHRVADGRMVFLGRMI